jgi:REP element-mobilizing transposase RayT
MWGAVMQRQYLSEVHHRRSIRLTGYDYSQAGVYFITICTKDRECLFGDVVNGKMTINTWGEIVLTCWVALPQHYPHVDLDAFVIMPNHVHGVVLITHDLGVGAGLKPARTKPARTKPAPTNQMKRHGLSEIVRAFKTFSARRINESRGTPAVPVWQRNYYEHIIRDENELNRTRDYIQNNPAHWSEDENHPEQVRS